MILRSIVVLLFSALAACQDTNSTYLTRGPGLALDASRASRASSELYSYISVMCIDAGYTLASETNPEGCPNNLSFEANQVMLSAGFNEINLGCKSYVQFIFEERWRKRSFKSNNSAIQSFIGGVLTLEDAGTRLFSYLVLSSAAANAFYDASRIDPLQGMSVQNILKIVNRRQAAFERAASSRQISSRPQLVRLWREYQGFCTPLSINSDFNALAAASIDGTEVNFDTDAKRVIDGIADTITNVQTFDPDKGLTAISGSTVVDGSIGAAEKALTSGQVRKLQLALCISLDGVFGPGTRSAIDEWRKATSAEELTDTDLNQGLTAKDVRYLIDSNSCSSLGYNSAFERGYLYDDAALQVTATEASINNSRANKTSQIASKLGVSIVSGATNVNSVLRAAVQQKREEFGMPAGTYIDYAFFKKLFE